ncbi:hypothetical protein [Granulicella tundricola]|uniref:Uncharacterized protein n=1 Tax=Granulicella tundricola (strain ATCC BAA-1859 / DSM 23138 / MP5ACTX9) TaxID=1198114 RepID=E8X425_GRATM|nr:hypothetical protein [Granulicella tundricola]ADW70533.1 hypothetical protein AciX9_3528 [Granulicella tundricola MP5ACTX9]
MTQPTQPKGQLLPGIAGICIFMLVLTLLNVFGALSNAFGTGRGKYGILALCSLLVIGIFGLLRMRRWGWALVLAGCLLLSFGDFHFFKLAHSLFFLIRGFFMLLFFLYLVRSEVRDRLV